MVYFRLSDHGRQILSDKFIAETDALIEYGPRVRASVIQTQEQQTNAEGVTKMSLWEFASTFGPHVGFGFEPVVIDNAILLDQPAGDAT